MVASTKYMQIQLRGTTQFLVAGSASQNDDVFGNWTAVNISAVNDGRRYPSSPGYHLSRGAVRLGLTLALFMATLLVIIGVVFMWRASMRKTQRRQRPLAGPYAYDNRVILVDTRHAWPACWDGHQQHHLATGVSNESEPIGEPMEENCHYSSMHGRLTINL